MIREPAKMLLSLTVSAPELSTPTLLRLIDVTEEVAASEGGGLVYVDAFCF